ncbi:TMEM165/GDT1 family protein [Candidatus Bathyarchaeota archaeon]|nr:TMEM165/GDT1 family protein [Candidatus Bathyarchaeota archaeon]
MISWVEAFWVAFIFVALAEIGDKTQLMAMSLSARYRDALIVLIAAVSAAVFWVVIGVVVGSLLAVVFPFDLISKVAGILFIIFGILTLKGKV